MKKKLLTAALAAFWLAVFLAIPVSAVTTGVDKTVKAYDFAGLFSADEAAALSEEANRIGEEQGIDLVIVTIEDDEGLSSREYADDFYDYNGFADDGLLMLINMDEREVWFSTAGSCMLVFSDRRIEALTQDTLSDLSDGDYAKAAGTFLDRAEQYLAAGEEPGSFLHETDDPDALDYTPESAWSKTAARIPMYLLIAGIIAGVSVMIMVSAHKTARKGQEASQYLERGTVNIQLRNDQFLRTSTTRVRIDHDNGSRGGSRGGGSSIHTGSSGRSHGGGGGRF